MTNLLGKQKDIEIVQICKTTDHCSKNCENRPKGVMLFTHIWRISTTVICQITKQEKWSCGHSSNMDEDSDSLGKLFHAAGMCLITFGSFFCFVCALCKYGYRIGQIRFTDVNSMSRSSTYHQSSLTQMYQILCRLHNRQPRIDEENRGMYMKIIFSKNPILYTLKRSQYLITYFVAIWPRFYD